MPWPWRRRKSAAPAAPARHAMPRQASWAQPAFPPGLAPVITPTPAPAPETAPAGAPVAAAVLPQGSQVRLGFVDGSEIALEAGDPRALALRAVAELLVQDRPD